MTNLDFSDLSLLCILPLTGFLCEIVWNEELSEPYWFTDSSDDILSLYCFLTVILASVWIISPDILLGVSSDWTVIDFRLGVHMISWCEGSTVALWGFSFDKITLEVCFA